MPSQLVDLASALADPVSTRFLEALGYLSPRELAKYPADQKIGLLVRTGALLDAEPVLSAQEKSSRFGRVLFAVRLETDGYIRLAASGRSLSPELRSTLASALPEALRPSVYRTNNGEPKVAKRNESPLAKAVAASADQRADSTDRGVVLSLSAVEQNAARNLLTANGFALVRVNTPGELRQILAGQDLICACLVDASYLRPLDANAQRTLISELAHYSSFMWMRIDSAALVISCEDVLRIIRDARACDDVSIHEISLAGGSLTAAEITNIGYCARILGASKTAKYVPGELNVEESDALISVAARLAERRDIDTTLNVMSLRARFLRGGHTTAKVVLISINDAGAPIIAKIDTQAAIKDEAARFQRFIRQDDTRLSPCSFFYKKYGIIAFQLIDDVDAPFEPAPTLEDRLRVLWWRDIYGAECVANAPDPEMLGRAIQGAANRLLALNMRSTPVSDIPALAAPNIATVQALATATGNFGFPRTYLEACQAAQQRFKRLDAAAVVHGDVHLRNILIRGDRESYLVDYALSGPGHPAVDLVRLELSLYFRGCRTVADESRYKSFQAALSDPNNTADDLIREFADIAGIEVNRVVIRGAVSARDGALSALRHHGGSTLDYLVTKYLLSWQALIIDDLQTALCRSVIAALAPKVREM